MSAISKACVSKKMCSVNSAHLANGLFAIFMVLVVEAMTVFGFRTEEVKVAIAVAIIMQIPAVYFVVYAIKHLMPYKRKAEFELYFTRLENITDAATLQNCYHIVKVDEYGVLYTDKDSKRAAEDWAMVCKGTPTRSIEKCMSIDL